jgi:hypothetical protein
MSSLYAALDEEMKEVNAILEGKQKGGRRTESPSAALRTQSPGEGASPMRSMLDVDNAGQRRSSSRGATGIPFAMPRRVNPESAYKFDMAPSVGGQALPKRVTQGGLKDLKPRAMSSVYGNPSGFMSAGSGKDRHNSASGPLRSKSGSPGPHRSASPRTSVPTLSPAPMSTNTLVTDSGKLIDGDTAYRKLSDSALAQSDGALSNLPKRKGSDPARGITTAPGGGTRLTTDDDGDGDGDGDESAAVVSSDDDSDSSDWDDGSAFSTKKERGRRRTRRRSGGTDAMGREIITAKSLFATAEQEGERSSTLHFRDCVLTSVRQRHIHLLQRKRAIGPRPQHQRIRPQR